MTYILLIHTHAHTRNARARAHDLIEYRHQSSHTIKQVRFAYRLASCTISVDMGGESPPPKPPRPRKRPAVVGVFHGIGAAEPR